MTNILYHLPGVDTEFFQFDGVTLYDASLLHAQAKRQPVLCDKYMSAPARGGY